MSIVKFITRTLRLLVIEVVPSNCFLVKLFNCLREDLQGDLDGARGDFFLSLEQLVKAKMHDIWYIVAQYLLDYQQNNKCKIIHEGFVSLQLNRVFRNVLSQKDVNFIDLFGMIVLDNHCEALLKKLENEIKTDQQKVNLLTLTEMYNVHMQISENVETIRNNRIKHYYYMEFCKHDPSIKGKFNAEVDDIEQLLKEFHSKQLDVTLLERMSRDFGLDYQQILITQVISILSNQEPLYDIKNDSFGDEELVMISSADDIRSLCQPYIDQITNLEQLTSKLIQFLKEINMYFYELYLCVIDILSFLDMVPKTMELWVSILHFLKHKMVKRRRNRASQLETDMWLQSQSEIGVLPKIARYRLPFKPIVEQPLKDILESELCVDNCESWFPLIQMHTILKGSMEIPKMIDYFCMSAVKNSIGEYKTKNNGESWNLQPTNNAFLKSVLRLVKHVKDVGKAFMILYFVSNYAPEGADQVEATYECYKFATESEAQITDPKYHDQLLKIKRKYPILKTQHLLFVYGLTDEKLLHLVENPTELIFNLYHHDLILKSTKLDFNTVIREIADLHGLDIEHIQYQLLQKWLSFSMESVDGTVFEETLLEDQTGTGSEDTGNAVENVIRANYVLNSWPKEKTITFLVAHIFADSSVNTSKQLQMSECFSKLNDGSSSFTNMLTQRQYITIKCVHELKQLGYKTTTEKFVDCNKIDVLKTIWQRNTQNPNTLQLLANICLGFDIFLAKIWNGILKRMTMFNMINELNALVDVLSCQPQLLHTDGLAAAWDYVLGQPFKNANQTRSSIQEDILQKTLFRLQSCPVIHKLNSYKYAEICVNLDRVHMAAIMIGLCKDDDQKEKIKKLIIATKCKKDILRKDIMGLEDAGILRVILHYSIKELGL